MMSFEDFDSLGDVPEEHSQAAPEDDNENKEFEYIECKFCEWLWHYSYPTFLALGLFGNALCILVFTAHNLRRETRILCSLCSAIDSLALVSTFASRWPELTSSISNMNPALCHALTIANYWLPELAAWMIVYLSLERFLSVLGYRWLAHVRYCVIIIFVISFVLLLLNVYFILLREPDLSVYATSAPYSNPTAAHDEHILSIENEVQPDLTKLETHLIKFERVSEGSVCIAAFERSHWALWNLVDLALSSLGPFAFIFVFNVAIILQISRKNRQNSRPASNRVIVTLQSDGQLQPVQRTRSHTALKPTNSAIVARDLRAEKSVTLMLLVATFLFLVMRTPFAMGHSVQTLLSDEKIFEYIDPLTCMTAFAVAELFAFIQHTIQFYVYFTFSAQFRQALRKQLGLLFYRLVYFLISICIRSHSRRQRNPETRNVGSAIPLGPLFIRFHTHSPSSPGPAPFLPLDFANRPEPDQCSHAFFWTDEHTLFCNRCRYERVVHHPSCPHFRDDQRFNCECLKISIDRTAHIDLRLSDF